MTRLFKREAEVTLVKPLPGGGESPAIVVRNLRVIFNVEKSLGSDPNTCSLSIFNLAENTRGEVQTKPLSVRLDAGYDGDARRIFSGDLRWAESKRENVDWETKIELGDGERAMRFSRINKSWTAASGINGKTAIKALADSMGLDVPTNAAQAISSIKQFASGLTVQGPSFREMNRILAPQGLSASIQDGRLQILGDTDTRFEEAIVISQDTGMIGTPESGAPHKKGETPRLAVRTLLDGKLMPGGLIQLEARAVNGVFRLERVVHSGDTRGPDWVSTIEAKPI